jgi:hypothetical protein
MPTLTGLPALGAGTIEFDLGFAVVAVTAFVEAFTVDVVGAAAPFDTAVTSVVVDDVASVGEAASVVDVVAVDDADFLLLPPQAAAVMAAATITMTARSGSPVRRAASAMVPPPRQLRAS